MVFHRRMMAQVPAVEEAVAVGQVEAAVVWSALAGTERVTWGQIHNIFLANTICVCKSLPAVRTVPATGRIAGNSSAIAASSAASSPAAALRSSVPYRLAYSFRKKPSRSFVVVSIARSTPCCNRSFVYKTHRHFIGSTFINSDTSFLSRIPVKMMKTLQGQNDNRSDVKFDIMGRRNTGKNQQITFLPESLFRILTDIPCSPQSGQPVYESHVLFYKLQTQLHIHSFVSGLVQLGQQCRSLGLQLRLTDCHVVFRGR